MTAKIDHKDKKILHFLSVNARESDSTIAKAVGLSRTSVTYRIKRLENLGIIKKYLAWINTTQLGYNNFQIYLKLKNFTIEKQNKIIEIIKKNPNVKWFISIGWPYDLFFVMSAKDMRDLDLKLKTLYSEFEEDIANTKIFLVDTILKEVPPFFSDTIKFPKDHDIKPFNGALNIDKTDVHILEFISENARANVIHIKEFLDKKGSQITPEGISYRLKKLKKFGILKKYAAVLDYKKLGLHFFMIIFKFNKIPKDLEFKIKNLGNPDKNIIYADRTIDHRIRIEILAETLEEVNEAISYIRSVFNEHVEDYEILPLFEEHILTTMPRGIHSDLLESVN